MRANGTATANSTRELVKEIAVLKSQLKKLSASIEKDAGNGIGGALDDLQTKSKETIDEVIETAQAFIDEYSDSAKEATKALMEKSARLRDDATDTLVETVKARPIATLATVIGIGFLAGYLCRRS
ncbi:MAG: hypothetical protein A3D94_01485 [Alphaproteobacteria bacterium RIFCSPHIGHO2_12_FULL_66_14]|jgi:ElaB/YqjD/DUF883 family membrane-anchored ribosome-binding protein|nr:MAG: hypothetical protein A3D94_01485 [Alphaproteobacteria bacterium RIFCSPHIGHO2_12_FULL_66_14]